MPSICGHFKFVISMVDILMVLLTYLKLHDKIQKPAAEKGKWSTGQPNSLTKRVGRFMLKTEGKTALVNVRQNYG